MIEIIETKQQETQSTESKIEKIRSITMAWHKIDTDPGYAESQKDLVSRTSMSRIHQIITEGKNEEYQRIDL